MPNYLERLITFLNNIDRINGQDIELQGGGGSNVMPVFQDNVLTGVTVTNLGKQPFLPMSVFGATIELLLHAPDHKAIKGSAMNGRLGSASLPMDSVEGHVAFTIYGKQIDDSVFQRITPISRILGTANVCINGRGHLQLIPYLPDTDV